MLVAVLAGVNAEAAGYFAQGGRIYNAGGREIQIRGISHFGFNATILQPQFLWAMGWKQQIAQIKSLGFNAIRVPFVPDTLYSTTPVNQLSYVDSNLNPELIGKTPLQALDLWMAEADRQGLYILLDFHSVSMQRQYPTWFVANPADFGLIYNKQAYTVENWIRDLAFVARRYTNFDHFLGVDLYNEPNGVVRWSTGDANAGNPIYFWKAAAERASAAVLAANPKLLVFVQGINGNFDGRENSNVPMNWGEDFQPQAYQPLDIPDDKLVLSPHTYGPDVYMKSSFSASNFPANLAAHWDTLFGQFHQKHSIVIGEWGGRYGNGTGGQMDAVWQNAFVDYLISKGLRNGFYWSYTPNSGDTGGILDDNLNVRQDKLALLKRLWGNAAATPPVSPPPPPPPASPPPTTRPVPPRPPSSHHRQPSIAHFSPASGPPGTVVTVHGSGFAGAHRAWIGAARDAAVNVISDTQLRVTIPVGATSGAIGIFNPPFAAFTATWFTVRGSSSFPQPSIDNFTPSAGPAGTVVTLNGSGLTGSSLAWIGAAKNAAVRVISDSQVQLTIPPGATSGAIGIFNAQHAAFTARAFTVTGATRHGQPGIMNFSPHAGPVGTVVTVNGSGFTGSNVAWIGAAKNAAVKVISDTQVQVTIPSGATSGAIGIFNPAHAAFTASAFTVR